MGVGGFIPLFVFAPILATTKVHIYSANTYFPYQILCQRGFLRKYEFRCYETKFNLVTYVKYQIVRFRDDK